MTISTTIVKNSYSGDNSTATFNYTFKILTNTDLKVIIRNASGAETTKTLNTHYTIANVGNASGGSITFTGSNIPTATETVVLLRDTAQTQAIDYVSNDPFPAETHEEGLDRSVILAQELQEEVDRSLKLSRTNTMTNTEFTVGPTERANKVLGFDSSGELSVTTSIGENKGDWASGTAYNVRDIVKDTSTNNIFLVNSAHTSSGAQPLTTNTNSAKYDLLVDSATATTASNTATTQAGIATTQATASAASAASALSHKNDAETAKTAAETASTSSSTSATASAASATAAQPAQAAAEAALDTFDDKFLGAKTSNPTVDNDGNALTDGSLYYDTTNNVMKVYDLGNAQWLQLTPTNSQLTDISTAATNISNINTVAGISSDVTSISNIAGDITSLANSLEKTYVVTVANVGGTNVFVLDGVNNPAIEIIRGNEYIFDVSDSSVSGHPLAFKDGSGNAWTSGVTVVGTAGTSGAKVKFEVPSNAPSSMRYYCTSHGNAMGNTIAVSDSAINTVASNIASVNSNASNITSISNVNSNISQVQQVASNATNINTVASNITGVNSFADRYRVGATNPTSNNDEGDLFYNSTDNRVKFFNGTSFVNIESVTETDPTAIPFSIALG